MFLLVPAYPGCPGSKAVKRSLLLLLLFVAVAHHHHHVRLLEVDKHNQHGVIAQYESLIVG